MGQATKKSEKQSFFESLKQRGFVYQSTEMKATKQLLDRGKITFYLGIDPTADSLHIGHLYALMMFKKLQAQGHKGILLFGGATGLVGDPTGKQEMRQMLSNHTVENNINQLIKSAQSFINPTNGQNPTILANNADWFDDIKFVDFMRDIGIHFNVKHMLTAEAYTDRLNSGLTFLEMSYMLMQAYDFVVLNKMHNCVLQIGGSDQWGNIVAGTKLYRKIKYGNDDSNSNDIFGLTSPLLLTKSGKKMGKTEKGTLWLDCDKTTPYEFYQYFYNIDDQEIATVLKAFSDIEVDEIDNMIKTDVLAAKKRMAYEMVALVHGKTCADSVIKTSSNLFDKNIADIDAPTVKICLQQLNQGINITNLCVTAKLVNSTSQARQLIESGAIWLNNKKVTDIKMSVTQSDLDNGSIILKKGKKNFVKIEME
ncbi:MAG: tyrosine--tRNA ligase [Clostridiales bacterium]|jgi:tyrosyl-tRNA synthetase|nr:tyrosine--tRNA ligase [Clostridiales bacterium]